MGAALATSITTPGRAVPAYPHHPLQDLPATTARHPRVCVVGADAMLRAGVAAYVDGDPSADLSDDRSRCDVVVAVVAAVDDHAATLVRSLTPARGHAVLLIADELDAPGVARAVRLGALGVLRRSNLQPSALGRAVTSVARGEAVVPPDLLGQLFGQTREDRPGAAEPPTLSVVRVTEREQAVLRHLAEGADTREIAQALRYSERTVKTVIQDLTRRFGLRNRTHAVAYALRNGLL